MPVSKGGTFKTKNAPLGKDRIGVVTAWVVDKVEVTQTVETVKSKTGELDTCVVSYTIRNGDDKPHTVGVRVMLDTHLGTKAKQHFAAQGFKDIVSDKAEWKGPQVPAVLAKYGGRFLVRGPQVTALEGKYDGQRLVVIEFPSMSDLEAFYRSPEYAPLIALRKSASTGDLWAMPGV